MSTEGFDHISIEQELKRSYLDYAMSVIVGRALPDARDGFKPVHRRVLYAMYELKNDFNKPYKKSARIVGDVIGKYHPHGETAVYDAIVRLVQNFSMRYPLIDGQGNFGSMDGDRAAAMRYTEIRMAKLAHMMLEHLEKDTVDFVPNYDGSEQMPDVLPTRFPNLLVNGSSGIAVGMATNIPPHNMTEVLNACIALIENPNATVADLMEHVKGPDFPTAGIMNGGMGVKEAYETGRGKVLIRARAHFEDMREDRKRIVVDELPYQVNKARLLEKIGELVRDKKLTGISAIRDESDKDGMRMVVELKRGESEEVVLNNLYKSTQMQLSFGINMVALDEGQPKCMNLLDMVQCFVSHRRTVITRRTQFDLAKSRARAHILEGLAVAISHIDDVVRLIKAAKTPAEAKAELLRTSWKVDHVQVLVSHVDQMTRPEDLPDNYGFHEGIYVLSPDQAQAILDLRLHRLTGLEQDRIQEEYLKLIDLIKEYLRILGDYDYLMEVLTQELIDVRDQYGDVRRTEILPWDNLETKDFIPDDEVVITLSHHGYIKAMSLDTYGAQRRGGKGKSAASMKDEDVIKQLLVASRHNVLLCFTNSGRLYWLEAYTLPLVSRQSKGRPIVNMLPLQEGEIITNILPLTELSSDASLMMVTEHGVVKRVLLEQFSRPRASGIIAIDLDDGDHLIHVALTTGALDVLIFSNAGKAVRFNETEVRTMGRAARGVRGMRLKEGQRVVSVIVNDRADDVLIVCENGYGKRTEIEQFRKTSRGTQGVIAIQTDARNGALVSAVQAQEDDDVILITNEAVVVRTRMHEISKVGRQAKGVKIIALGKREKVIDVRAIHGPKDEDIVVSEEIAVESE